ncbi:DNA ligase D [Jeotgalibacillus marinus]|uniref:DNA ligase (ATP) n=1 Tax=Jeotgalibacillus marinus TaxID=86667 RepID=A0ABV3Q5F3_9BACL
MKPMLLTATTDIPIGKEWLYEAKYDGFRCLLTWENRTPQLMSRNGKSLNNMFPEIIDFCDEWYEQIQPFLPLTFDGELVYLINHFQSDFSTVQVRGRMSNANAIKKHVNDFPCHYVVFDLLTLKGEKLTDLSMSKRKEKLQKLFKAVSFSLSINDEDRKRIQSIDVYENSDDLWKNVVVSYGEGIVAKKKSSTWKSDKRTVDWLKIKNWRYISVFLTTWDKKNGYFHGAIYKGTTSVEIVHFRHGLEKVEEKTLIELFQSNGKKDSQTTWELDPSVCVDIACIAFDRKHLREPRFHAFNFDKEPADCTWKNMQRQLFPLPEKVEITHPDKPIWPTVSIEKDDYLLYLQLIAPYLLPFLRQRLLTVIRYPHGAMDDRFYQKNCPDYAPDFVLTNQVDDIKYIVCNDIETLLWLGNQLALEFHIPFQTTDTTYPTEIVFDLDPPSVDQFSLAIEAATRMKTIFDQLHLESFVKTSGGKGLQVYIPLPTNTFSYEETRIFTSFVCRFLCEQEPQWFTTERLKKNRHNKLYLDYIQHDMGKTIIAPYSPRGNEQALIATPLNWSEVNDSLKPDLFSMPAVLERIKNQGNPFRDFRKNVDKQKFADILAQLKE